MYLSSARTISAGWLVNVCKTRLCSGRCTERYTPGKVSLETHEQRNSCCPFVSAIITEAFAIQQNTLLVCQPQLHWHSLKNHICMWQSLSYHIQTFLSWTALRHSATTSCRPDLSDPCSESHVGHCNHLSQRKNSFPEYKLEWIQASCDYVLFIVCFIAFSTDTSYLPQIFCKYCQ